MLVTREIRAKPPSATSPTITLSTAAKIILSAPKIMFAVSHAALTCTMLPSAKEEITPAVQKTKAKKAPARERSPSLI